MTDPSDTVTLPRADYEALLDRLEDAEEKATLDQSYNQPNTRQRLFGDYQTLQSLAKNFRGRSYNIDDSTDREAMKIGMLSSLRPEALKLLEEVAQDYHRQFDRPLPVSSLVRPEQYQHTLHKFNRNAVIIESPPHSTGLAFDIDYRYMSAGEQNFLMAELARMKNAGRIEVLRDGTPLLAYGVRGSVLLAASRPGAVRPEICL